MTEWNLGYRSNYNAPRCPRLHIAQDKWLWIDFAHLKQTINHTDNDEKYVIT